MISRRALITAGAAVAAYQALNPERALAALSDQQAMSQALRTFGQRAAIGHWRRAGFSNWEKQVGYWNDYNFIVLGRGRDTWDAAFANVATGAQVRPPTVNTIQLGRINIAYDVNEQTMRTEELEDAGAAIQARPTAQWEVRAQCEERLAVLIQEMLVKYPGEVGPMMQSLGITLNSNQLL